MSDECVTYIRSYRRNQEANSEERSPMLHVYCQLKRNNDHHTRIGRYLHQVKTNFIGILTTCVVFIAYGKERQEEAYDSLKHSQHKPSEEFEVSE